MIKKIIFGSLIVVGLTIVIALAGIYKFGYLSNKEGHDVDGNKISEIKDINNESEKTTSLKQTQGKTERHLISPAEFKEKVDSGEYMIVDIRTPEEFQAGHVKGAINVDFYSPDFKSKVAKLNRNKKYLYYCRSGHRSGQASALAKELGFNVAYELKGGINAWQEAGYKIETEKKGWYKPKPGISWQWQLDGPINVSYKADLYDIDLFDTPQNVIDKLHKQGKKVICYFSAGSWEDWRPDAGKFSKSVIGKKMEDWAGEKWLNVADYSKFAGIMQARMDLAVKKKCDGVEPDNVDGYTNKTGFKISAQDQINYNKWLASEAHKKGLAIALKNDIEQVGQLVNYFDFAINEQCFEYNECAPLQAFIKQGKAVLGVEYELKKKKFCPQANAMNFSWLKMSYDLKGGRDACR